MKYRVLKRVISLALAVSATISLCACDTKETVSIEPMEQEEVYALGFDFIGGDDVMPIGGFYGPYSMAYSYNGVNIPYYVSDDIYSKLSESGLNYISWSPANYAQKPDVVIEQLELAEKYNMGVFVNDTAYGGLHRDDVMSIDELEKRISEYSSYPAFCGVYAVDEPGTSYYHPELKDKQGYIEDYVELTKNLTELGVVSYVNLISYKPQFGKEVYHQYLDEFSSTLEVPYLCSTLYPFDDMLDTDDHSLPEATLPQYFYQLDSIRAQAEKTKIPYFTYIAAGGSWSDAGDSFDSELLYPNEAQFTWNVNTALAYGTKGITYFLAIQPVHFAYGESTEFDAQRNGLLGIWGNKTQWWYYAKNVNAQIAAVDDVLMNSVSKGVIVTGEEAKEDTAECSAIMEGASWRELKNVKGDTMIGCFNYQGKTALYVVNYDMEYAQHITLELYDTYNMSVTQNAEVSRVKTNSLTLDMKAGEGALIVFE